jgi:hypothetical protein
MILINNIYFYIKLSISKSIQEAEAGLSEVAQKAYEKACVNLTFLKILFLMQLENYINAILKIKP